MTRGAATSEPWPSLPLDAWSETCAALHLWTQMVGKVRLATSPRLNHSWHVTLYVTARGLTTSAMPHGARTFQVDFDFVEHELRILASDGARGGFGLEAQPVSRFYGRLFGELDALGLPVRISRMPNELPNPVRFDRDDAPRP
ncbi:MAG TPA: DUF5996 family protein, partial [Myxococcota bacterium]|nr:DUF5996 family protein [Myxococcota bacterium]